MAKSTSSVETWEFLSIPSMPVYELFNSNLVPFNSTTDACLITTMFRPSTRPCFIVILNGYVPRRWIFSITSPLLSGKKLICSDLITTRDTSPWSAATIVLRVAAISAIVIDPCKEGSVSVLVERANSIESGSRDSKRVYDWSGYEWPKQLSVGSWKRTSPGHTVNNSIPLLTSSFFSRFGLNVISRSVMMSLTLISFNSLYVKYWAILRGNHKSMWSSSAHRTT